MRAGNQSKDWTRLGAVGDDHWNVRGGIGSSRDFEVAGGFLARSGRSGTDGERRSLS